MKWRLSDNERTLVLVEATSHEVDQLTVSFTKQIASARFDPKVKRGIWDGNVCLFKHNRFLPAGLWGDLVDLCEGYDFDLEVEGMEKLFDEGVSEEDFGAWVEANWALSGMENRAYQTATAWRMVRTKSCLAELATSAGKSLIAFQVLAWLMSSGRCRKALVIVPTTDLVVQITEDFLGYNRASTKLDLCVQQVYSDAVEVRGDVNLVVGTWQSLVKWDAQRLGEFDVVFVDEVHSAKSKSIMSILEKCVSSTRRIGLSGTIPKEGTLDRLQIMSNTGPVVTQVKADQLIREGHISPCEVYVLEMNYAQPETRAAFRDLFQKSKEDRKVLFNLERNYAIESNTRLQFVTNFILKNRKNSLVLFHRVEYGRLLYDTLRQKSVDRPVYYIDGSTDNDFRGTYKDFMEDGVEKILVASFGTFSTGINVKNLHTVYLTESFKSEVIIRQSIGRGLRKHSTKDRLIVVDFVDDFRIGKFTNFLFRHSEERRRIYQQENFPFQVRQVHLRQASDSGLFTG